MEIGWRGVALPAIDSLDGSSVSKTAANVWLTTSKYISCHTEVQFKMNKFISLSDTYSLQVKTSLLVARRSLRGVRNGELSYCADTSRLTPSRVLLA
jgi:hypothetical protein